MKKKISKIVFVILILATAFISLSILLKGETIEKVANYGLSTIAKAMSASDKLEEVKTKYKNGDYLYISDEDLAGDSNLYCIEFGTVLGANNTSKGKYPIKEISEQEPENAAQSYILGQPKDTAERPYMSSVQIAVWDGIRNDGTSVDDYLKSKNLFADEDNYYKFAKAAAAGKALVAEANAYASAQARYKAPTQVQTNPVARKHGDKLLLGPFKISYSKEVFQGVTKTVNYTGENGEAKEYSATRGGKIFSQITGAQLYDQNKKEITSNWYFTDGKGNSLNNTILGSKYAYPDPNQTFYIVMDYNENVTELTGMKFKFSKLEAINGKYYTITGGKYDNGEAKDQDSQNLMCGSADIRNYETWEDVPYKTISLRMNLSGTVFKDIPPNKANEVNGKNGDATDVPAKGVIVTLVDATTGEQIKLENKEGEIRTNPTLSNDNGYYEFRGLDPTKQYRVKFTYNGQEYEPTIYNQNTDNKAQDIAGDRQTLNNRFAEIKAYPNNYISTNSLGYLGNGPSGNIAYPKYTDGNHTTTNLGRPHLSSKEAKNNNIDMNANNEIYTKITNKINSYIANNKKFPSLKEDIYNNLHQNSGEMKRKLQFIEDTKTNASTVESYGGQENKVISDITDVSFGMKQRSEFDLAVRKDIDNVKLTINGKEHTYDYRTLAKMDFNVPIRTGEEKGTRTTEIYQSDYAFRIENYKNESIKATLSKDQELKVFVTYRIIIRNQSGIDHPGKVTQLIDYYDSTYTYRSSYIGDRNGNKLKDLQWAQGERKNGYNSMSTTGLKDETISNNDLYLYVTYEVNKDDNGRIRLDDDKSAKRNVVEIMSYISYKPDGKTIEGLIDMDSIPGNYNPANIGTTTKYEDDTDQATGLKLSLKGNRTLNGYAWEDKTVLDKTSKAYIGNGIRDKKETLIEGITVQLVEIKNGKEYIWQQATTSKDGFYKFDGYIPGDYIIRFRYGDTEATVLTKANGGKNNTSYNGQDYKSTIYQEKSGTSWHLANSNKLVSDARDSSARRTEVNNYSKEMTNYKAQVLTSYQAQNVNKTLLKELIANTNMFANTDKMFVGVEKADTAANTIGNSAEYKIENIDLGLAKRPTAQLELTKDVANVKVILEDETVLFDTSKAQKDIAWMGPNKGNEITVTMDENLMQGATIELTYKMYVTNVGQTDYVGGNFYYTGKVDAKDKTVTTKATKVVDYVANNLVFDPNREENRDWEEISKDSLQTQDAKTTLVDKNIDVSQYGKIIQTKNTNNLVKKALKPGEKTEVSSLVLTKVIAKDDENDDLTYTNIAEIVRTTNDAGRRHESSIIGNQDPNKEPQEVDADNAELVRILPPYGGFDAIFYYGIAIVVAAVILGVGIFFIKKKVINKDEK